MKWILIGVAAVAVLVVMIATIGSMLPRNHRASRSIRLHRSPDEVWAVVTGLAGASDVPVEVIERVPPHRLVTRVTQQEKNFGGTWTIAIAPEAASNGSAPASVLTITEDGWVANPIFRFVSRVVIGHHATMDGLLKQVAAKFSEPPVLSGE
jgi:hypothetical protein